MMAIDTCTLSIKSSHKVISFAQYTYLKAPIQASYARSRYDIVGPKHSTYMSRPETYSYPVIAQYLA